MCDTHLGLGKIVHTNYSIRKLPVVTESAETYSTYFPSLNAHAHFIISFREVPDILFKIHSQKGKDVQTGAKRRVGEGIPTSGRSSLKM